MDLDSHYVHGNIPEETNGRKRSRDWCYTVNWYSPDDKAALPMIKSIYHIYGFEVAPTTGTPHIQGYIRFKDAKSRTAVSKIPGLTRAWLAKTRGTPQQAADYCKKDDDFVESGELPMSQTDKGNCNKERYAHAWILAKKRDIQTIADEYPHILMAHYSTIQKIGRDFGIRPPDLAILDNVWVWGEPLTGKTAYCNSISPNVYIKSCNKWWMGYQPDIHFVVHVNDFGLTHKCLGYHVKMWAENAAFMAEDKNGGFWCRPKRIFISSNYHPSEIWMDDPMMAKAVLRRFHIVHAQRNDLVDTFGYLFRTEPVAVPNAPVELPECPDAPIGPGPGEAIFDPQHMRSGLVSPDDSLNDINIVCNSLNDNFTSLNDISLDECLVDAPQMPLLDSDTESRDSLDAYTCI